MFQIHCSTCSTVQHMLQILSSLITSPPWRTPRLPNCHCTASGALPLAYNWHKVLFKQLHINVFNTIAWGGIGPQEDSEMSTSSSWKTGVFWLLPLISTKVSGSWLNSCTVSVQHHTNNVLYNLGACSTFYLCKVHTVANHHHSLT